MQIKKGSDYMITQWFKTLWEFISNIVAMLASAVTMVISGVSGMQIIVTYMPAVVGAGAIVSIAVLVVRFLCLK